MSRFSDVFLSLPIVLSFLFQVDCSTPFSSARLLKFVPLFKSRETIYNVFAVKKDVIDVDGAHSTQVSIFALSSSSYPTQINISCQVAALGNADPIMDYEVCRKKMLPDGTLGTLDCDPALDQKYVFNQFKVTRHPAGLNLTRETSQGGNKLSGSYACLLKNRHGSILSNWFRITDINERREMTFRANKDNCPSIPKEIHEDITTASLPYSFSCCQKNVFLDTFTQQQPQYGSPYSWKACSSKEAIANSECAESPSDYVKDVDMDTIGGHVILPNGTLVLLSLKSPPTGPINLLCKSRDTKGESFYFYGKQLIDAKGKMNGVLINIGDKYEGAIQHISPEKQDVVFEPRKINDSMFPYSLLAIYKAPESVTFEWKKDGRMVSSNFATEKFRLHFPEVVNASLQGIYSLWLNGVQYFTFNVTILTVPHFLNEKDIFDEKFVIHGESVSIFYNLSHPGDKKKVYINGYELAFDGSKKLSQLIHLPALKGLNAELSPVDGLSFDKSTYLQYRASNLVHRGMVDDSESHMITLGVENAYGESHVNSIIKVLPYPRAFQYPASASCSEYKACPAHTNITIPCQFPLHYFRSQGAHPLQLWYLNDTLIDQNEQTFSTNSNTSVDWRFDFSADNEFLRVVNSSQSVVNVTFTCRLLVLYPAAMTLDRYPADNFTGNEHLIIFDSQSDSYRDKAKMSAVIDRHNAEISMAYIWMIAVALALLLLIIALIMTIVYYRNKEPKESYNVEEEELKQGHNPQKEIRDNEEFHDYERGENGNLLLDSPTPIKQNSSHSSSERLNTLSSTLRNNGTTGREPRVTYRRTQSVEDDI